MGSTNKNGAYRIAHIPRNQQFAIQANSAGSTHALSPLQSNQLHDTPATLPEKKFHYQVSTIN